MRAFVTLVFGVSFCILRPALAEKTAARQPSSPLVGFADYHVHQFSDLAFGGKYVWGAHDGPPAKALRPCSGHSLDGHGFGGGLEGGAGNLKPHGRGGYPHFDAWPRYNTTSHQQAHAMWLERAWRDGLRLVVVSLVNNRDYCRIIPKFMKKKGAKCDDFSNIRAQARAARAFEKKHRWYRIVTTPAEARRVIGEGRLAVVLALEASNAFDDATDVLARLREYHALGIRSVQIVHEINNRLGGAAWHDIWLRALQTLHNLKDWRPRVKKLFGDVAAAFKKKSNDGEGVVTKLGAAVRSFANRMGGMEWDKKRDNVLGLTDEGRRVLQEMMRMKMIVDIAHLSRRAVREALEIARKHAYYPLFNSHADVSESFDRAYHSEWKYPAALYAEVAATGGVVGLRTGPEDRRSYSKSAVANDCPGSVKSFAHSYEFATRELGLTIGFACDVNGWASNLMPRFGRDACGAGRATDAERKAFRAAQTGRDGTDFDTHGFAHVGMLGPVMRQLRHFGVDIAPLLSSAEAFVRMWERGFDTKRTRVDRKVDVAAALATLGPERPGYKPGALDRFYRAADRVSRTALRSGCYIEACVRSPLQCLRRKGKDFDPAIAACDRNHGKPTGVLMDKWKFLSCAASWLKKGLAPFSGVKLRDVPARVRERCK
jgi:microsomal dipeptidase-like Zn-dependent dipeptidase